jgi:hypothetical protein
MFLWLLGEGLKEENESERTPAHDQALHTNYHATKILQTDR